MLLAGVVDQDVEPAELLDGRRDQLLAVRLVRRSPGHGDGLAPGLLDRARTTSLASASSAGR